MAQSMRYFGDSIESGDLEEGRGYDNSFDHNLNSGAGDHCAIESRGLVRVAQSIGADGCTRNREARGRIALSRMRWTSRRLHSRNFPGLKGPACFTRPRLMLTGGLVIMAPVPEQAFAVVL